jgi:hypothetical protein
MDKETLEAIKIIREILVQIIRGNNQSFSFNAMEKMQSEFNKLTKIIKAGEGE